MRLYSEERCLHFYCQACPGLIFCNVGGTSSACSADTHTQQKRQAGKKSFGTNELRNSIRMSRNERKNEVVVLRAEKLGFPFYTTEAINFGITAFSVLGKKGKFCVVETLTNGEYHASSSP